MLSDLEYEDFDNLTQITPKNINYNIETPLPPKIICNIFEVEDTTKREGYLQKILNNNQVISKVIKNNFLFKIRNFFQFSGVPIHIKSGTELDIICPKKDSSDLDDALSIEPLGIFVSSLPSIFLAGDRIAYVAYSYCMKFDYTNLAYIVRIHEIMHWLFQWKEKPSLTMSISREYEYIEESFANYMTLLWIDWLTQHIDEDDFKTEKYLLDQNIIHLKEDAIRFMRDYQPEAYAVAVQLYEKCNPFDNDNVLPFINWCFQKNKIKAGNRTALVKNLRELYKNPKNYSTNDIITWYKALFA